MHDQHTTLQGNNQCVHFLRSSPSLPACLPADLLVEEGSAAQVEAQLAAEPQLSGVRVCVPSAAQPMPVEF